MKKIKLILCITSALIISSLSSVTAITANGSETKSDNEAPTVVSATIRGLDASSGGNFVSTNGIKSYGAAKANGYATAIISDSCDVVDKSYFGKQKVDVYGTASSSLVLPVSGTIDGIPDWTMMVMCQLYVSNANERYVSSPTSTVYNGTYVSERTKTVQGKDFGTASCTGYHTVKDYYGNIIWNNETYKSEWI